MTLLIRTLIFRGLVAVLIFTLGLAFLHLNFLHSGLWWMLFSLLGLSELTARFASHGHGIPSTIIEFSGNVAMSVIVILAFVFFWWQGGAGMVVAAIIWILLSSPIAAVAMNWLSSKTTK